MVSNLRSGQSSAKVIEQSPDSVQHAPDAGQTNSSQESASLQNPPSALQSFSFWFPMHRVPSSSAILRGFPTSWNSLKWFLNGFSGECYGTDDG